MLTSRYSTKPSLYLWRHSPGVGRAGITNQVNHSADRGTQGSTVLCELASDFHPILSPSGVAKNRGPRLALSVLTTSSAVLQLACANQVLLELIPNRRLKLKHVFFFRIFSRPLNVHCLSFATLYSFYFEIKLSFHKI